MLPLTSPSGPRTLDPRGRAQRSGGLVYGALQQSRVLQIVGNRGRMRAPALRPSGQQGGAAERYISSGAKYFRHNAG